MSLKLKHTIQNQGQSESYYDDTYFKKGENDELSLKASLFTGLPAGGILPYAGSTSPEGWEYCDGGELSRTEYANLFSAIGTTWGAGDGSTTFNKPDLRGAFVRGDGTHESETKSNGSNFVGPSLGSFENDKMPGHHHTQNMITSTSGGSLKLLNASIITVAQSTQTTNDSIDDPITDGVNGAPRTGDESAPFCAGVKYIIKT